jgi:hypothetical protein
MRIPNGSLRCLSVNGGFTRIDLCVLILTACFGVALANPLFTSHSRARSDALVCQDNLAQIGRGHQLWANDHEDRNPLLVATNEGGLWLHPLRANAYIHFGWLSNGLASARVLACPADTNTTRRAKDFSTNLDGGLMYPRYRNEAVSYFVGFHAQRQLPRSILSGDRNIMEMPLQGCSYTGGFSLPTVEAYEDNRGSRWGQKIHWEKGNLLFDDGSAEETSTTQLRAAVIASDDLPGGLRGSTHILPPKTFQ